MKRTKKLDKIVMILSLLNLIFIISGEVIGFLEQWMLFGILPLLVYNLLPSKKRYLITIYNLDNSGNGVEYLILPEYVDKFVTSDLLPRHQLDTIIRSYMIEHHEIDTKGMDYYVRIDYVNS